MKSMIVSNNMFRGDVAIDPDVPEDANIVFSSNVVDGDFVIKIDFPKDIEIENCKIEDGLVGMGSEVWFMYHNVLVDGRKISDIVEDYKNGKIRNLRFRFPRHMNKDTTVIDIDNCVGFLAKYHTGKEHSDINETTKVRRNPEKSSWYG